MENRGSVQFQAVCFTAVCLEGDLSVRPGNFPFCGLPRKILIFRSLLRMSSHRPGLSGEGRIALEFPSSSPSAKDMTGWRVRGWEGTSAIIQSIKTEPHRITSQWRADRCGWPRCGGFEAGNFISWAIVRQNEPLFPMSGPTENWADASLVTMTILC